MKDLEFPPTSEPPSPKRLVETFLERFFPRWLVRIIFYLLSIASILWLGFMLFDNWQNLKEYTWTIRWGQVFISFLLYALAVALALYTWIQMMATFETSPRWYEHTRSYCISRLGYRLPGPMLHIPGRLLLYNEQIPSGVIWFVSTIETLIMLCACVILSTATSQLFQRPIFNYLTAVSAIGLLFFLPKILKSVFRIIKFQVPPQINFISFIKWTVYHIGVWILGAGSVFALINAFYDLQIHQLLNVISAWAISGLVSLIVTFLPMGFGLRELSLSLLLDRFLSTEIAVLTVILTRFLLFLYDLVIAAFVYFIPSAKLVKAEVKKE